MDNRYLSTDISIIDDFSDNIHEVNGSLVNHKRVPQSPPKRSLASLLRPGCRRAQVQFQAESSLSLTHGLSGEALTGWPGVIRHEPAGKTVTTFTMTL